MTRTAHPRTVREALAFFSGPARCVEYASALRWPGGVRCPTCRSGKVTYLATRRLWKCRNAHPRRQFSVKSGTLFEDSAVGLDNWFALIWMIANQSPAPTSYEIAAELGVTQKTAWYMLHRIRAAIESGCFEYAAPGVINVPPSEAGTGAQS